MSVEKNAGEDCEFSDGGYLVQDANLTTVHTDNFRDLGTENELHRIAKIGGNLQTLDGVYPTWDLEFGGTVLYWTSPGSTELTIYQRPNRGAGGRSPVTTIASAVGSSALNSSYRERTSSLLPGRTTQFTECRDGRHAHTHQRIDPARRRPRKGSRRRRRLFGRQWCVQHCGKRSDAGQSDRTASSRGGRPLSRRISFRHRDPASHSQNRRCHRGTRYRPELWDGKCFRARRDCLLDMPRQQRSQKSFTRRGHHHHHCDGNCHRDERADRHRGRCNDDLLDRGRRSLVSRERTGAALRLTQIREETNYAPGPFCSYGRTATKMSPGLPDTK